MFAKRFNDHSGQRIRVHGELLFELRARLVVYALTHDPLQEFAGASVVHYQQKSGWKPPTA